jgi:hypothetical protein
MSPLTLCLAKFFGVFCLLMTAAMAARPKETVAAIEAMKNEPGLMLVTGILTMGGGVAAVLGHNVWSGGVLPLVVTLLAWVTLIKGFALIALSPSQLNAVYRAMNYPERFRATMLVGLVLSAALTVAAFAA